MGIFRRTGTLRGTIVLVIIMIIAMSVEEKYINWRDSLVYY